MLTAALPILTLGSLLSYDNIVFDIDGVLFKGSNVIQDSDSIMNLLAASGKNIFIVTNNDWSASADRAESFRQKGFQYVTPNMFINPLLVAVDYFRRNDYGGTRMFVLGPDNVKDTLHKELSIEIIEDVPMAITEYNFTQLADDVKIKPRAVVLDSYVAYNMYNLARAINYVMDPYVELFSLSSDDKWLGDYNLTLPDAAPMQRVVERVAGRRCTPLGKPSKAMSEYLKPILGNGRTIMFGDNLLTDVQLSISNSWDSALVFTGVTSPSDLAQSNIQPTYIANFTQLTEEAVFRKLLITN